MKEILYIQAGSFSNYTGTHFWNTQQSYFTYDEDEDPLTLHDLSFREGLTAQGEPTYTPRLLVFDRKSNFGTLSEANALLGNAENDSIDVEDDALWSGSVLEYRQDLIPKSDYQKSMDEELRDPDASDNLSTELAHQDQFMRYWSDFNRVYYIPRTIQRLPDVAEWEHVEGDWNHGVTLFSQYNEETELMEGPVRLFAEECDSLQGIQVMNDTTTFGAFIDSFLTSFRDEYLKLPSVAFPFLSSSVPGCFDVDDHRSAKKAVNDALALRSLNELSSMSIPVQSPWTWRQSADGPNPVADPGNVYHASAVISAHIETATLPLRLKNAQEDLASFSALLDWRGSTRFGQLSGVFPVESTVDLDHDLAEFSVIPATETSPQKPFALRSVSRGFAPADISAYDIWRSRAPLQDHLTATVHAPAYPLPTSYPPLSALGRARSHPARGILAPLPSAAAFAAVSTGSGTTGLFARYAGLVEACVQRGVSPLGLHGDDMRELANDLWTVHDGYTDGEAGERDERAEDAMGEDE